MHRLETLTISLITLILTTSALADVRLAREFKQNISQHAEHHIEAGNVPGLAVLVVADGEIVLTSSFGRANEGGTEVTAQTTFSIGSVTKPFVGMAIDRLVGQGKLNLDDPIQSYLPELIVPRFNPSDPADTEITTRHLLNHSSGLTTFVGNRNQAETALDPELLQQNILELESVLLATLPGTHHEYSNANYQLLGALIEKLTGQPFPQAMHDLVFTPLQLNATQIRHSFGAEHASDGFRFWGPWPVAYRKPLAAVIEPAGGMSTDVRDLGKALIGLTGGNDDIANIWDPAWAVGPQIGDSNRRYGLGWSVLDTDDGPIVFHHGLNPGFSAGLAFSPSRRLGIAVLTNASDGFVAGDTNLAIEQIIADVFPELGTSPVDFGSRWLQFLTLVVLIVGLLALAGRELWQAPRGGDKPGWVSILLPTAILFATAYGMGFILPPLIGIPLAGVAMFSPDIGWILQILYWLCLVWGVLRLLVLLRVKAKQ